MRRGVVFVIGLATLATGVWLIANEHQRNTACDAHTSFSLHIGTPAACQDVAFMYFFGFVVAGIGVLMLIFTRLIKRHESRYRRSTDERTDVSLRVDELRAATARHEAEDAE